MQQRPKRIIRSILVWCLIQPIKIQPSFQLPPQGIGIPRCELDIFRTNRQLQAIPSGRSGQFALECCWPDPIHRLQTPTTPCLEASSPLGAISSCPDPVPQLAKNRACPQSTTRWSDVDHDVFRRLRIIHLSGRATSREDRLHTTRSRPLLN